MTDALRDKVIVVAGATRGCGRAIAVELGAHGATVFCCGRSVEGAPSEIGRTETIEQTARRVSEAGGTGIPARCDFGSVSDVDALVARLESEVDGRLDVLVNDTWGGDIWLNFADPYWETPLDDALAMVRNGLETHLIALHRLLPLLVRRPGGLCIEVTDGDTEEVVTPVVPYYLVKSGVRALGRVLGATLTARGGVGLAVTPGYLRSEKMLDIYRVTEQNWRDAVTATDLGPNVRHFVVSETPHYLGRGVAALVTDPDVARFAGRTLASWTLAREYGFTDTDGTRPDWGRWYQDVVEPGLDPSTVDDAKYR